MELKPPFYKWVPVWIKLPALFIFFFVVLTANGVYLGNATDMYSGLGVYPEPFSEAYNAVYIGMGLGLLVEVRLKLRFSGKTLLLWGFSMMLIVNVVNMFTGNPSLMVAGCLILGFTKMAALIEIYIPWLVVWSKKMDTTRMYPFVYFTALGGIYFITWLTAQLAWMYNWRLAYIAILIMLLVCILFALVFVEDHPLRRRMPLYQMDTLGISLLLLFLLLLNYISVYGKTENWWESSNIRMATILLPVSFFAFVAREMTVKRPAVPLRFFKKAGFVKGLFLFFLLGIFLPSSIQGTFTAGVLDFENIRNAELNLFLIPGVTAAAILCYCWYFYKLNKKVLLFIGFGAFVLYYYILYTNLATGLGLGNFWTMSLLKGFAITTLYIVIGLYTTSGFPLNDVLAAGGIMILVRSFLGSGIISGVYSYLLYAGRVRHLDILAGQPEADAGYGIKTVGYLRDMELQATMTASKELCGIIITAGLVILGAIIFSHFFRSATHR